MSAGEGDEANMVVQFILDAVKEIEERASAIGREAAKSKGTSGKGSRAAKKNTKNTSKKGQKRKRSGKGGKTSQSPDQLEVIEEVQEEEEEGEKENKQPAQPAQPAPSVNSSMILEGEEVELEVEDEESIRLSQDDGNIFSQPLPGEQEQQEQPEQLPIQEETQPIEDGGKETPLKGDSDSFDDEPEY